MKLPRYVQGWVDRKTGRARYHFRRRGFPRTRLPGLPWSPQFMAAYEAAMSGPRPAIGAGRIKPGSVAAVVSAYLDSQQFFGSKSAGTQRMRRGILERFRAAYGDRPFALLPPEWIEALLDNKPPQAARSWLVTLRDPGASALASDPRCHAERALDVPSHRDRQALWRESFQRNVPRVVRRRRTAEALQRAWIAQGHVSSACGSRCERQRDREHQRTCKPE
jgi:hypothetical protein